MYSNSTILYMSTRDTWKTYKKTMKTCPTGCKSITEGKVTLLNGSSIMFLDINLNAEQVKQKLTGHIFDQVIVADITGYSKYDEYKDLITSHLGEYGVSGALPYQHTGCTKQEMGSMTFDNLPKTTD